MRTPEFIADGIAPPYSADGDPDGMALRRAIVDELRQVRIEALEEAAKIGC